MSDTPPMPMTSPLPDQDLVTIPEAVLSELRNQVVDLQARLLRAERERNVAMQQRDEHANVVMRLAAQIATA